MDNRLTAAIGDLRMIQLHYEGGYRLVEPHAYGHNDNKGHDLLRAYQVSGSSNSFEFVGWKLFRCDEMLSVQVLDQHFAGPRSGYKRGDKALDHVYAEL